MSYKCEIVADSINSNNNRLTTFLITYPRIIHSELMTHRVFSRNSASSRAIPFEKMVKMVEEDPFIPIAWQKDHKGMQGSEYWIDDDTVTVDEGDEYERYTKIYSATEHFITEWLEARDLAIAQSYELNRLGVTKQLCNRLLEPFMWHTVLVTGTEWENFFELRCPRYYFEPENLYFKSRKDFGGKYHECFDSDEFVNWTEEQWLGINQSQAEIHIQKIAEMMWDVYNESIPKELEAGEWHIPFGDKIDYALDKWNFLPNTIELWGKDMSEYGIKVSTARCARLSYMTFDGEIDYEKDIKLHDQLLESHHASPFEHCCRVLTEEEYNILGKMILHPKNGYVFEKGWVDNFKGFISYRRILNI